MTLLTTARTTLVPFAPADADCLLRLFRNPAVRRYLLDGNMVSQEWVDAEIAGSAQRFMSTGAGLWSANLNTGTGIIGFAGFREFFEPPQLQLIYGLLPAYWGRGLATEIANCVGHHAFSALGFTTLRAAIDSPNVASGRVLERLGFCESRSRDGHQDGTRFYELTRSDWLGS